MSSVPPIPPPGINAGLALVYAALAWRDLTGDRVIGGALELVLAAAFGFLAYVAWAQGRTR